MNYRDWYCVQVAAGCENKSRADLLARKEVLQDRYIKNVESPEASELVIDKGGKRKMVKKKIFTIILSSEENLMLPHLIKR